MFQRFFVLISRAHYPFKSIYLKIRTHTLPIPCIMRICCPKLIYFSLHGKLSFPLRISSVNVTKLVTFTQEILNGKLHFVAVFSTFQ